MEAYELHEKIGSGGFSKVYRATKGDEEVAVKICIDKCRRYVDMLCKEANIMSEVSACEGVVPLIDSFVVEDSDDKYVHAFVMPYLNCGSVEDLILQCKQDRSVPDMDIVREVARQIGNALAHCHSLGVVHSDLKCDNIMIADDATFKLCDFGSAFKPPERPSTYGHCMLYASPEIVLEEWNMVKKPTDVWSLGCVLFEIATCGDLLFDRDGSVESDTDYSGETDSEEQEEYEEVECDPLETSGIGSGEDTSVDSEDLFVDVAIHVCEMVRVLGKFPHVITSRNKDIFSRTGRVLRSVTSLAGGIGEGTCLRDEVAGHRGESVDRRFINLLTRMLKLAPKKRITARRIRDHAWFA